MMKLLTVPEMLEVEQASDRSGHTYAAMMECAGQSLAEILHEKYGQESGQNILAFVGKGNNGGDALVALTHLREWGWKAVFILVDRTPDKLVRRAAEAGCLSYRWPGIDRDTLYSLCTAHDILLDGLLGTGIRLPLRPPVDEFLALVNAIRPEDRTVVAVDTPSGVDCRTGMAAEQTLLADLTVTMAAAKTGFFAYPAANYIGELYCGGIGLDESLPSWSEIRRWVVDRDFVRSVLPTRPPDAHKGTFGTAIICAGSTNFVGAALLAGKAAFRTGAGLVTTACTKPVYRLIAGQFPEATWLPLPSRAGALCESSADRLVEGLGRASGLLVGPGFGLADSTMQFIERLVSLQDVLPPMIIDADGLKLLARLPDWASRIPSESILTPHPGEMSVLSGLSIAEIQAERINIAERFSKNWGHVVVLKGAFTVVAAPDGRTALIPIATPALARAGTGDVLAGMITGLRTQGLPAFEAALSGAWLHAQAGIAVQKQIGNSAAVLAGDLLEQIPRVMAGYEKKY